MISQNHRMRCKLVVLGMLALPACNTDHPTPGQAAPAAATPGQAAPVAAAPVAAAPVAAAPAAAAPGAVIEAGCSYDARQLKGNAGDLFAISCPAGCEKGQPTWGTGVYSANSAICRAGIHAGAIPAGGGTVTVRLEAGRPAYRGSEQHGITSSDYNDYAKSYAVLLSGAPAPTSGAAAGAVAAGSTSADKAVIEAGCSYDGRQLKGNAGDVFAISCPGGCEKGQPTWGTKVYSANSAICRAGIHAGAIPASGGTVQVRLEPGRPAYRGSEQHGITSSDYNEYNKSYAVLLSGESPAPAAVPAGSSPTDKAVIEAGCSYDGRQLKGNAGDVFAISCPAGCEKGQPTWGTGVYSANSAICRAGIHAGAIPVNGGTVQVRLEPGRPAYRGSEQHGITSSDYNEYAKSYAVVLP